jgi:hypothetical protein
MLVWNIGNVAFSLHSDIGLDELINVAGNINKK